MIYFHVLFKRFIVVFHHKICAFLNFYFFFWQSIKFPQQNINQQKQELVIRNCQWKSRYSFLIFAVISQASEISRKYEKLVKYLSCSTQYLAITSTYREHVHLLVSGRSDLTTDQISTYLFFLFYQCWITIVWIMEYTSEAYSEPCQTSKMERFAKIFNAYSIFL